jgi:hypothetical protein
MIGKPCRHPQMGVTVRLVGSRVRLTTVACDGHVLAGMERLRPGSRGTPTRSDRGLSIPALASRSGRRLPAAINTRILRAINPRIASIAHHVRPKSQECQLGDKIGASCKRRIGRCTLFWAGDIPILGGCGDTAVPRWRRQAARQADQISSARRILNRESDIIAKLLPDKVRPSLR